MFYTTDAPKSKLTVFDVGSTTVRATFDLTATPKTLAVTAPLAIASDVPSFVFIGMNGMAEWRRYRSIDSTELLPYQRFIGAGSDPTVQALLDPRPPQDDLVLLTSKELIRFPATTTPFSPAALARRSLSTVPSMVGVPVGATYSGTNVWVLTAQTGGRHSITRLTEAFSPTQSIVSDGTPVSVAGAEGATSPTATTTFVSTLSQAAGVTQLCAYVNGNLSLASRRCISLEGDPVIHSSSYVGEIAYAWVLTKGPGGNRLRRVELRATSLVSAGVVDLGPAQPLALSVQPGPSFYVSADPDPAATVGFAHVLVRL
ncbi:MAG: hypothetical protein JNL79_00565 [Myxococcales bacterium]|nr:hypothetical protein [Myxococcales bacterium]